MNRLYKNLKRKWLFHATLGLLLIGAGISIIGEGVRLRIIAESFAWFWLGLLGLISLMSGLSFFGDAIRFRVHLDKMKQKEHE